MTLDWESALLVRTVRYALILFVTMGVYPKMFPLFERRKKRSMEETE